VEIQEAVAVLMRIGVSIGEVEDTCLTGVGGKHHRLLVWIGVAVAGVYIVAHVAGVVRPAVPVEEPTSVAAVKRATFAEKDRVSRRHRLEKCVRGREELFGSCDGQAVVAVGPGLASCVRAALAVTEIVLGTGAPDQLGSAA